MNRQKVAIVGVMFVIMAIMGSIVLLDVVKNDRLDIGLIAKVNPQNWDWPDSWKKPEKTETPALKPPVNTTPPVAQQIVANSYQEALSIARQKGMPVLVYFEADWCSWCKKMKNEVLTDAKVKAIMTNYVLVHVNTDSNPVVSRKFNVQFLPSYVITNSREDNLKFGEKYIGADPFCQWLNNPQLYKQSQVPVVTPPPSPPSPPSPPQNRPSPG